MSSCKPSSLTINDVVVNQDSNGRYCLNDLHRAAVASGINARTKEPGKFLSSPQIVALVHELTATLGDTQILGIAPVESIRGGPNQGTYVCRTLVFRYAAWVSAAFELKVYKVFEDYVDGRLVPTTPSFPVPKSLAEALRLAADLADKVEAKDRQLVAQKPAVEFLDRFVEAKSTKGLREVAKVLGLKEKDFVARLVDDGVMFRQSGRLLPSAEYQHRGYFEVKTGETRGYVYAQVRFTPAGIAWAAKRYAIPAEPGSPSSAHRLPMAPS
ncbi:phage antirepressor KilAC domain-containing protein [Myxococcus virescens]|uniref:Phage antirepressor protein YoqD, KilAC domain n=1 Tax=Myxococcus virescens TaxID=83456 RepID=A0A511HPD8_9BACT|nr:phage antirepressor KilAC domain-containing protein [Myxococcus virescens]GEL75453.1 hypothetical protein MVI01_72370 [Myxococcus virescens]SDE53872.1 Phage antirepressor protein YoqD, KilAC domain [Myxococcus virescens]